MMLLTFVDVVARYVFNRPLRGAFEVTELMLLVLIFAGLPLVSFADEHAVMDFIDRLLGPAARSAGSRRARAGASRGVHVPARLAGLAQGRPHLGLPGRHRRAAHRLRPVRLLHGGHDRRSPALIHLYKAVRAPMIEGLVGLAADDGAAPSCACPSRSPWRIVGIVGYAYMRDWNWTVAFAMAQTKLYETGRNYTLSVVPLFILMGNFVTRAGMSQELFRAAYAFIGHLRGGLAMATVWASAGFGGICGSSIATAATFAKVAYPSMKRFGYSDRLAAGVVAGGGHARHHDPAVHDHGDLRRLHRDQHRQALRRRHPARASWAPSCSAAPSQYMTWRDPASGPPGERSQLARALLALKDVWAVAALFLFVMGGIYGGLFTATEGAGMGAFGRAAVRAVRGAR